MIDLSDVLGKKVGSYGVTNPRSEVKVETQDLFGEVQNGIYLIKVKTDFGSKILKWIKQ